MPRDCDKVNHGGDDSNCQDENEELLDATPEAAGPRGAPKRQKTVVVTAGSVISPVIVGVQFPRPLQVRLGVFANGQVPRRLGGDRLHVDEAERQEPVLGCKLEIV